MSALPMDPFSQNTDILAPQSGDNAPDPLILNNTIISLIQMFEDEDQPNRDIRLRYAKRAHLYWDGIQNVFFDSRQGDWIEFGNPLIPRYNSGAENTIAPKVNNIYKPLGQSIIAALTPQLPNTVFWPANADNPNDIVTSKVYKHICTLLERRNDCLGILAKSVFLLWNQDYIALHNYALQDKKFGTVREKVFGTEDVTSYNANCSDCGSDIAQSQPNPITQPVQCPNCNIMTMPENNPQVSTQVKVIEEVDTNKISEVLEVYGLTHIRIPTYASKQEEIHYLILECEIHTSLAIELFPDQKKIIYPSAINNDLGPWARNSNLAFLDTNQSRCTYKRVWLRPFAFNSLFNDDEVSFLKKTYPDGALVHVINDKVMKIEAENLDDHWTFPINPASMCIAATPLGYDTIPLQEAENDTFNLIIETIRFSIPITFADPRTINFQKFGQTEALPGQVLPAKIIGGQSSLDAGFKVLQTANFSPEIQNVEQMIQSNAQFISGALPSIFGGVSAATNTLGQAELDHNQALQRLSLIWKMLVPMYRKAMQKAVKSFIDCMLEDESFVKDVGAGNFLNVWIRKIEAIGGKVGDIVAESSEDYPVSWIAQQNMVLKLLQFNNQVINNVLFDPSNTGYISKILGLSELNIPGEDQRFKQLVESVQLVQSAPTVDPMSGQPSPSVPINPTLDDHAVHIATMQKFLNSEGGMELQSTNQQAFQNCILHLTQHTMALQQQQAQQAAMQAQSGATAAPQGQ